MNKKYPKTQRISVYIADSRREYNEDISVKVYLKYPIRSKMTAEEAEECSLSNGLSENESIVLLANVRQLSAAERFEDKGEQDGSSIQFVINDRPITQGMYIEYRGNTYIVGAPDRYDFVSGECKFRAKPITPPIFDKTEYKAWSTL